MNPKLRVIGGLIIFLSIPLLIVADNDKNKNSSSMVNSTLLETNSIAIKSLKAEKLNNNLIVEDNGNIMIVKEEFTPIVEQIVEQNVIEEEVVVAPVIVYDNLTLDQLAEKLERNMKGYISGSGYFLASYSLERGVDPYMALAIILLETGCNSGRCSTLTTQCNNVGGQHGRGSVCGNGPYAAFNTLDEGMKAFVDNLANNYIAYGLTTPETINKKYATSDQWAFKVNNYINKIRAN